MQRLFVLILGIVFMSCAPAQAKLLAAVSIAPQAYFLKQIAGDRADAVVMVPPGADAHTYEPKPRQLADLYWELVYQALVQGDLRDHACTQALHYCEYVLARQPDNAALVLRKGRLLHAQGQGAQAQAAYAHARTLGLPATRVLPYEAELCFEQRDFPRTQALMRALDQWGALPRLRPVINYWKGQ